MTNHVPSEGDPRRDVNLTFPRRRRGRSDMDVCIDGWTGEVQCEWEESTDETTCARLCAWFSAEEFAQVVAQWKALDD